MTKEETQSLQTMLNKYQKYIDNIKWHIVTNTPDDEPRAACELRISDYEEVVRDLQSLTSKEK